jgi:hypothetical protein
LNATLPCTRNAVGPTDYTPVACSPKKYKRTTSAAHELATSIVFTSGLIHFADRPEFFQKLPAEAFSIIRDAPARWDESRCLAGEPGQIAVFGRRTGQEWFFAGINGANDPRKLDLDLIAFEKWPKRLLVTEDPGDPQMKVIAQKLDSSSRFQHTVPGRGGFILRLSL